MNIARRFSMAVCAVMLLAAAALTGCAQNTVRLNYTPDGATPVPSSSAARMVVALFEDQRENAAIGVRKDGTPFQPASSVAEWVSQSLADELARKGVQVSVASGIQQAQVGSPDYVVSGVVEQVWMVEKGVSTYEAAMRVKTVLTGGAQPPVTKTFTVTQSKTGIPGAKLAEDTLSTTLADLASTAASSIMASVR